MSRKPKPDPNADTSDQDVLPQGSGDASTLESSEQDTAMSSDNAPLSADATKNPVIINR